MSGGSFGVFVGKMEQSDDIDQRQTRQKRGQSPFPLSPVSHIDLDQWGEHG